MSVIGYHTDNWHTVRTLKSNFVCRWKCQNLDAEAQLVHIFGNEIETLSRMFNQIKLQSNNETGKNGILLILSADCEKKSHDDNV